jgi:glycerol-3-phosphate dehydrogenase
MSVFRALFTKRTLLVLSGGTVLSFAGGYYYLNSGPAYPLSTKHLRRPPPAWTPPSRDYMLSALRASGALDADDDESDDDDVFDILIVGGGATGAGVAVDAASRGLKVALVERDDFSAGKSFFRMGTKY